MTGEVMSYGQKGGYGFIEGETGEIFFFHCKEWHLPIKVQPGLLVEFTPTNTEKGRRALDIQRARRKV